MMGALLWYKISDFIAQSYCSNFLKRPKKDILNAELKKIEKMTDLMMAYASTFYWKEFFQKAVEKRAYSNLPYAMSLVGTREQSLDFVSLACLELEADDACAIGRINKFYQSLKKIQSDQLNPKKTKNLRLYAKINHRELLKLNQSALDHIELLGEIRRLDENLQAGFKGVSKYFRGLAEYDQKIAGADVTFLTDKLNDYDTKMEALSKKLEKELKEAMTALKTAQALQLTEEAILLKLKIA